MPTRRVAAVVVAPTCAVLVPDRVYINQCRALLGPAVAVGTPNMLLGKVLLASPHRCKFLISSCMTTSVAWTFSKLHLLVLVMLPGLDTEAFALTSKMVYLYLLLPPFPLLICLVLGVESIHALLNI